MILILDRVWGDIQHVKKSINQSKLIIILGENINVPYLQKNFKTMNMTTSYTYKLSEIPLNDDLLIQLLGADDPDFLTYMKSEIKKNKQKLSENLIVKGGYIIYSDVIFLDNYQVQIDNQTFSIGKIVYNMLKRSGQIAVFVCTAGPQIEIQSNILRNSGDVFGEYIVNTMGSLIVETGMDLIQEKLQIQALEEDLKTTNRYSPGYCNWQVSDQQKLFKLIPENYCGISLTESSLMQPIKSVSGFIGLGSNVKFNNYTCQICEASECIYRNIKNQ